MPDSWGVSTTPVPDFFIPRREVSIQSVINHVLQLAAEAGATIRDGMAEAMIKHLPESTVRRLGIFAHGEENVKVHRDEPVFDGQFSNRCYREAVKQAFTHFSEKAIAQNRFDPEMDVILTEQWARIIMHLPYAFQAKRMFPDVFRHDRQHLESWKYVESEIGSMPEESDFETIEEWEKAMDGYRRAVSKTESFKQFVEDRIEKGQRASSLIGNQYTGSIFLALMSTFEADYEENANLDNVTFGLCGYGSGAKAKVFEAEVQPTWREIASRWNLFERLEGRIAIDRVTYEALHKGLAKESVITPKGEFALVEVGDEGVEEGMRTYAWVGE